MGFSVASVRLASASVAPIRSPGLPREVHGIPPKRGELGLEIKRRSSYRQTLVLSLTNDIDFYVPTRKAFAEGSYEVTTSSYQPGGKLLVDGAVRRLAELKNDKK